MKSSLTLILAILFGFLYVFIFATSSSGPLGDVFAVLILIFSTISVIPLFQKKISSSKKVSPFKFVPILIAPISIVLSAGYLHASFASLGMLSNQGAYNASFFLAILMFSAIGTMAMETTKKIEGPLESSGYEREEIERELGHFEKSVTYIALASMLAGMGIILVLEGGPIADIGIFPAIILFFVVYVIVISSVVKKES